MFNEKTQQILPWAASALCLGYAMYVTFILFRKKDKVNKAIEKDSNKVVHTLDIEDIGKKTVLCRCWRSQKFPYCDGSHNMHNEETGDNVGPVIVKQRDA